MSPTGVSRRQFVTTVAATGALALLGDLRRFAKPPTNILFILADDMGYGDLSSFGRPDYKTPVLDRFAREGLRLTSCVHGRRGLHADTLRLGDRALSATIADRTR